MLSLFTHVSYIFTALRKYIIQLAAITNRYRNKKQLPTIHYNTGSEMILLVIIPIVYIAANPLHLIARLSGIIILVRQILHGASGGFFDGFGEERHSVDGHDLNKQINTSYMSAAGSAHRDNLHTNTIHSPREQRL